MPTFIQIEVLQTQCYIHQKTGWKISDFSYLKLNDEECIIKLAFTKKQNKIHIDNSPKSCFILTNGKVVWS
jgi:hypothetical protein